MTDILYVVCSSAATLKYLVTHISISNSTLPTHFPQLKRITLCGGFTGSASWSHWKMPYLKYLKLSTFNVDEVNTPLRRCVRRLLKSTPSLTNLHLDIDNMMTDSTKISTWLPRRRSQLRSLTYGNCGLLVDIESLHQLRRLKVSYTLLVVLYEWTN